MQPAQASVKGKGRNPFDWFTVYQIIQEIRQPKVSAHVGRLKECGFYFPVDKALLYSHKIVTTNRLRRRWRRWLFDHLFKRKKRHFFCGF